VPDLQKGRCIMKLPRLKCSISVITLCCALASVPAAADETFDKLINAKKYSDAIQYAETSIPSSARDTKIWYQLGNANEHAGAIEKALACYLFASRLDAKNYDAALGIARVYNSLNQPANAVTSAKKALDLQFTADASWEYARACIALNRSADAKTALMKVVESDPANLLAIRELGVIYFNEKTWDKAIEMLKKAYAQKADAGIALKLGTACLETGNLDDALTYLKASEASPETNLKIGRIYAKQQKFGDAVTYINKGVASPEATAMDYYQLANATEQSGGTTDEIIKAYLNAIEKFGASKQEEAIQSRIKAGNRLLIKKDYPGALVQLTALAAIDSTGKKIPNINTQLAYAYEGMGNTPKAIASWERETRLNPTSTEAYSHLGDLYAKEGSVEKTRMVYEKLAVLNPNDIKIQLMLGDHYLRTKKFPEALKFFQKSYTSNRSAEAAQGMAQAAFALNQTEMARDAAESALQLDASLTEPRVILASINQKENDFKSALVQLTILSQKNPKDVELWQRIAVCCEKLNNTAKLADADQHIIALDSGNTASRTRLAQYALANNDPATAYRLYQEVIQLKPGDPALLKSLYQTALKLNKPDEAIAYLKQYVTLKPADAEAQKTLANLLFDKKAIDEALSAYRATVKADSAIKGVYKNYSTIILSKTGIPAAEITSVLAGAVATGEADAVIYAALGSDYQKRAQYPKAIECYQKALQLDAKNIGLFSSLAFCQTKTGDIQNAVISYEQATTLNPAAVQEYKDLADLYMQQNKQSQAIAAYRKYLEKTPTDTKVALTVAEYAYTQKTYDDAVKYYGMSGDIKNADVLSRYAQACFLTQKKAQALELSRSATTLAPTNAELFKQLFDIASHDSTALDEARTALTKYTQLKPTDAAAQKTLADLQYAQKDYPAARNSYRLAIKADPTIRGIYKNYVAVVSMNGTQEEIVQALSAAIAANEADAGMYASLAALYQKQANYPKAIELYQKSLQLDGKNVDVIIALAQCQIKSGKIEQASILYEQAVIMKTDASAEYRTLGDLYKQQNKMDQAIGAYKKCIEKNRTDNALIMLVADYAFKNKNYDEAITYLNMMTGDDTKKVPYLQLYGQAAFQGQKYTKAAELYKQLAVALPQDADVFKTQFIIAQNLKVTGDAIVALKQYVALKPADAPEQMQLGDMLYDTKDTAGALTAYAAAVKANPSIRGLYKRYGALVQVKGTQEQIVSVLTAAIATDEADAGMYCTLAGIYQKQNACAKSIPLYQKALTLDPKNNGALASLAECQAKTGDVSNAVITYEQVIAFNPSSQNEYKALGDLYMKQNKQPSAIAMYRKYLEKVPGDADIAYTVGLAAYKDKNYADAVKFLSVAQTAKANDPEFLYMLGEASYNNAAATTKDYKPAIALLERIRNNPQAVSHQTSVLKMLANAYDMNNDTGKAVTLYTAYTKIPGVKDEEASFRKALLTSTSNPAAGAKMYEENTVAFPNDYRNFLRAGLYLAQQPVGFEKAIPMLKKSIALRDSTPAVWLQLGIVYGKMGNNKEEVEAYRQFIQRDPTNIEACIKMSSNLMKKGNAQDALLFIETANTLKPNDPAIMAMLAEAYTKTGRIDQAIGLYEKTEQLQPEDLTVKENLFALYELKNDSAKVLSEVKKILEKKRDAKYLIKYAQALYANGVYAEAENAIKEVRAADPENINALMLLGKIQSVQGKWDDALETFKGVSYINPNHAPSMYERAEIHFLQAKYQWAKTFYERALKADPKYAQAEVGLAKVARVEKDKAEYAKHIENAKKLDPNSKELLNEIEEGKKMLKQ
jgi:tetratricopeptide (TPR) repeat protein